MREGGFDLTYLSHAVEKSDFPSLNIWALSARLKTSTIGLRGTCQPAPDAMSALSNAPAPSACQGSDVDGVELRCVVGGCDGCVVCECVGDWV